MLKLFKGCNSSSISWDLYNCITSGNNCKVIKIPVTQKLLFAYCENEYAK